MAERGEFFRMVNIEAIGKKNDDGLTAFEEGDWVG